MSIEALQSSQLPTPPPAPSPPSLPTVVAPGSLAALQAQLVDLNVQLTGLRAERTGLRRQLESMLQSNPARPQVQAKDAEVGLKIANVEGQVAVVQAQIASKQGTTVIGFPPRGGFGQANMRAEMKVAYVLSFVILVPLALALARRIWRGAPRPAPVTSDPEISTRLGRLEQAVDTIAIEIERISEGQRFMTKIMAERPSPQASQPTTAMESVNAGAQSIRALGAGPMEPINVPARDGVRQSITPN
jgi:hypothetical protein